MTNGTTHAPIEVNQRAVLQEELAEWETARYRLEVRHRVAKKVGDPKEHLKSLTNELERCERWIDALQDELRLLEQPQTP